MNVPRKLNLFLSAAIGNRIRVGISDRLAVRVQLPAN